MKAQRVSHNGKFFNVGHLSVQTLVGIHQAATFPRTVFQRMASGAIRTRKGVKLTCVKTPKRRGFDGTLRSGISNRLREISLLGR